MAEKTITEELIRNAFRDYIDPGEKGLRHFAVLLPVISDDNSKRLSVLYEVRSRNLDRQPGEICFPGGLIEEGETPLDCALRETREEIGIDSGSIEIITENGSVFTAGGSQIHCFTGIVKKLPAGQDARRLSAVPNDEVEEVFTVELEKLMDAEPEIYTNRMRTEPSEAFPYDKVTGGKMYPWRDGRMIVPVYDIADNTGRRRIIWGLTGRITRQFIDNLRCRV